MIECPGCGKTFDNIRKTPGRSEIRKVKSCSTECQRKIANKRFAKFNSAYTLAKKNKDLDFRKPNFYNPLN